MFLLRKSFLIYVMFRSNNRRCSVKQMFLEILQNLQENTCARNPLALSFQLGCFANLSKSHFGMSVLLHIFRIPFPKNTSGGLLLSIPIFPGKEIKNKMQGLT